MMKHRERIHAALRGELVDRVPVALWQHFPGDDLHPEKFAARVVEFQKKFDFDFVKVTPASSYPAEMYGATFSTPAPGSARAREGTREKVNLPVQSASDWDKIAPLDASNPVFVREFSAIKLIRQQLGADVHILQTIFSPLNCAYNLALERVFDDLRAHPEAVHRALRALTETTARFTIASLRAGADAIFFATQMATPTHVTRDEFRSFGEQYDLQLLEAVRAAKPDFIFCHIHGLEIYFDALMNYPVDVLNWHDRLTAPSLKKAREILRAAQNNKAIAGGMDEWNMLAKKPRDQVLAQARDAIAQAGERGFILAAGCVIPVDTPEGNIKAVVEAVRE
jgi:uroporphyrinogen decarboxylase